MSDAFISFSYGFDGQGGGEALSGDAISQQIKADRLAWVHLEASYPETQQWLESEIAYLDPFIIGALLEDETRPRMTQIGDGVLLILRGANLNENADPEDMVSIRLWVDSHRIISVRRRRLRAVEDIEETLKNGKGPKDAGDFICLLVARLSERMEPTLSMLDDRTDSIEEQVIESADIAQREAVVDVRQQAIMFRRYIAPQREAVGQLRQADLNWLSDKHRRHLQESHNQLTRFTEDLDAIRERAQVIKDEVSAMLADRLNRNMYVLSVIAAIFLPLGFLTGLFGINIGGMPGVDDGNAFWVFVGALSILTLIQILIFKKLKWF